ncbi:hypothetical protein [Pseudoalteromonas rubra]|uniref:hypothetical protein n=1 Tax=Pseudoalteromonas rubra TaxID=43658 RepID=UPI002DB7EE88|nr:hypothetical protein [Pseudoalteromonas rubra]MEC4088742.1 hypothetical protein [Pseudoalteromonas rubra]
MTLTVLKISHLEPNTLDISSQIFAAPIYVGASAIAVLSTIFYRLKIERLIKQFGIRFTALSRKWKVCMQYSVARH